jgi:hypothetical protein
VTVAAVMGVGRPTEFAGVWELVIVRGAPRVSAGRSAVQMVLWAADGA